MYLYAIKSDISIYMIIGIVLHSYKKLGPKYPKKGRGRIGYLFRHFRVMSLYISIHFTRQAYKTSKKITQMFSDIPIKVTERYFFLSTNLLF